MCQCDLTSMQHHMKCESPRIPAVGGDWLIPCWIPLSIWPSGQGREAKRSWFVISSPAAFSLSPIPTVGHIPVTKTSWLTESCRAC